MMHKIDSSLANDMIEQLDEVARLARAIAKATRWLHDVHVAEPESEAKAEPAPQP